MYGGAVASFFVHLWIPRDSPSYILGQWWVGQPSFDRTAQGTFCLSLLKHLGKTSLMNNDGTVPFSFSVTVRLHLVTLIPSLFYSVLLLNIRIKLFILPFQRERFFFLRVESDLGACSRFSKAIKPLYNVLSWSSHVIDSFWNFNRLLLYSVGKEKSILLLMVEPIRIVLDGGYFKPISIFIVMFNRKSIHCISILELFCKRAIQWCLRC